MKWPIVLEVGESAVQCGRESPAGSNGQSLGNAPPETSSLIRWTSC